MTVVGLQEIERKLTRLGLDFDRVISRAVDETAIGVRADAVRSIQEQSVGRTYQRGNVLHVASAEGDPPNTDTGRLVSSLKFRSDQNEAAAYVETAVEYAPYLEFGTQDTAARPFLEPAMLNAESHMKNSITKAIQRAIK